MALDPLKHNTKRFTFRDEHFFLIFAGNGEDVTPAEVKAWVLKYRSEASELGPDHPLIVDFDLERADSQPENPEPEK